MSFFVMFKLNNIRFIYVLIEGIFVWLMKMPSASTILESNMTHTKPSATTGSTFTVALAGMLIRTVKQSLSALKSRREVARLNDLDDRALKDIGLVRSDVLAALGEPLFCDPSHHLMDVAGHKRSPSGSAVNSTSQTLQVHGMGRLRRGDASVVAGAVKPVAC
jgi:uncharacterized protein YjiS (DUF1127 family)